MWRSGSWMRKFPRPLRLGLATVASRRNQATPSAGLLAGHRSRLSLKNCDGFMVQ
jgi:hypothetical protein